MDTLGQFKVKDHATYYDLRPLTEQQATDLGCPGATHQIVGNFQKVVGTVTLRTGRLVVVPTWRTRTGYRATFTPAVLEGNEILEGYAVTV